MGDVTVAGDTNKTSLGVVIVGALGLIAPKLGRLIPIIFLVSAATFFMLELVPGDPAAVVVGEHGSDEQYEQVREQLGLDDPPVERYLDWLGGAVQGDFGQSVVPPREDVTEMITARLPVTLEIALLAMVLSLVVAIPMGLWTAYRMGSPGDILASGAAFGVISVPSFLSALLLIFLAIFNAGILQAGMVLVGVGVALGLAVRALRAASRYGWERAQVRSMVAAGVAVAVAVLSAVLLPDFPRQGFVRLTSGEGLFKNLESAFLPALTLALIEGSVFMRVLRNDMANTLEEDYILAARAKGMSTSHVLVRDALRPSSFSLVTVAGVALGRLLGGTVIVESIFGVPGMGRMLVQAIQVNNFPVVQASVLVLALLYVLINTVVDLSYSLLDPRIRRG